MSSFDTKLQVVVGSEKSVIAIIKLGSQPFHEDIKFHPEFPVIQGTRDLREANLVVF